MEWTNSFTSLILAVAFAAGLPAQNTASDGLLLVAHGARAGAWNERVVAMFAK